MSFLKNFSIIGILFFSIPCIGEAENDKAEQPEAVSPQRDKPLTKAEYHRLSIEWKAFYNRDHSEIAYYNWVKAEYYSHGDSVMGLINKGLEQFPSSSDLYALKGLYIHTHGDSTYNGFIVAIQFLEKAVNINPHNTEAWLSLVLCYMAADNADAYSKALHAVYDEKYYLPNRLSEFRKVLESVDANGVICTLGDNDYYPFLLLQSVENVRPYIRIINFSLLNLPWYVKMIKLNEPKVNISYSLQEIDALQSVLNPFATATTVKLPISNIQVRMPSKNEQEVLRVQDRVLLNLIDANNWKKPLYFTAIDSSTFNNFGLMPYVKDYGTMYVLKKR